MKAKIAGKIRHHAKPVRKNTRGRKRVRIAMPATKKETSQPIPIEGEIMEAMIESPFEFVAVDLEPVVEVFEVYDSPEDEEGEN